MRSSIVATGLGLAAPAYACSVRPGSLLIFHMEAITLGSVAFCLALTIFSLMRKLPVARRVCLGLLVLQPAWMMNPCCDCGTTQMGAAVLVGIASLAVFNWDMFRRREGFHDPFLS